MSSFYQTVVALSREVIYTDICTTWILNIVKHLKHTLQKSMEYRNDVEQHLPNWNMMFVLSGF